MATNAAAPVAPANGEPGQSASDAAALASAPATPIANAYREVAAQIAAAAHDDAAWQRLAHLTDRIGHRLSGSASLERAIVWAAATLRADGHENVRVEKVMVPHWVRGAESAAIVAPIERPLVMLGLGNSVGTPRRGVTAEVIVARSKEEVARLGAALRGKIVLYDVRMPPFSPETGTGYGDTVGARNHGAAWAVEHGAVAVLVRSVTAHSLRTPHTGATRYALGGARIPAAAITAEDADLIVRLIEAGETVRVKLVMGARTLPPAESGNVIAELRGSELPDEIVLIGAHLDSWDVGTGAHDDAGGCVAVMQALSLLRRLDLRPRRTIRVVLFTNEENGLRGAFAYADTHASEIADHVAAIETDSGTFAVEGFSVLGGANAVARARDIVSLLAPLGTNVTEGWAGADLIPLSAAGRPGLGLDVDSRTYFDYHHSAADTLDKVDPAHLQDNIAAIAVVAYVIADMPERLDAGDDGWKPPEE